MYLKINVNGQLSPLLQSNKPHLDTSQPIDLNNSENNKILKRTNKMPKETIFLDHI